MYNIQCHVFNTGNDMECCIVNYPKLPEGYFSVAESSEVVAWIIAHESAFIEVERASGGWWGWTYIYMYIHVNRNQKHHYQMLL